MQSKGSSSDKIRCLGNCGCHWLRVSDANAVFASAWPREIAGSGRWAVCFRDTCCMHVRYTFGRSEKNLLVKYLHHATPEAEPTAIQSDICARCGEVQVTRAHPSVNSYVPPFRFVPCSNVAANTPKK